MSLKVPAPIATASDVKALSWIVCRIREDYDRKGVESFIARHPDQTLDVLAIAMVIGAATRPDQLSPAFLGRDGEHSRRARQALNPLDGSRSTGKVGASDGSLGPECGLCGVRQDVHDSASAFALHGPHQWQEPIRGEIADDSAIKRARELLEEIRAQNAEQATEPTE